jgi:hypothetical protein
MNIIEKIGAYVKAGLSSAEAAVKLEYEHGVQVTEEWIDKIRSADGFSALLAKVEAYLAPTNNIGEPEGPTVDMDPPAPAVTTQEPVAPNAPAEPKAE